MGGYTEQSKSTTIETGFLLIPFSTTFWYVPERNYCGIFQCRDDSPIISMSDKTVTMVVHPWRFTICIVEPHAKLPLATVRRYVHRTSSGSWVHRE
jgi:hypothetical protein